MKTVTAHCVLNPLLLLKFGGFILFSKPRGCFNSYREIHISSENKGESERGPMTLQHLEVNQKRKRNKWIEKE